MHAIHVIAAIGLASIPSAGLPTTVQHDKSLSERASAPLSYCMEVLSERTKGFFPYCSPILSPRFGHSFTLSEAASLAKANRSQYRLDGSHTVPTRASKAEVALFEAVRNSMAAGKARQCLGQPLSDCIAALSQRMVVTSYTAKPFLVQPAAKSFEPIPDWSMAEIQIVLPDEGTHTTALTVGQSSRSPVMDVVELAIYAKNGLVQSVELAGRYPILSANPADYEGSGFAAFMENLFPECAVPTEMEFYQAVWENVVKPAVGSSDNGQWRFTSSGLRKSSSTMAAGTLCGLRASAFRGSGRGFTDEGKQTSWAANTLKISE